MVNSAAVLKLAWFSGLSALTSVLIMATPTLANEMRVDLGKTPGEDFMPMVDGGLEKGLAALPGIVTRVMERSRVPGVAVAVVHNGKTVFAQGFGVREVGKSAPVDPATVFQVASVSKSLTASVIAVQVRKGLVSWNDPVVRHLPQFKLSEPYVSSHATIGDFMAHHSGLPRAAGDDLEDLGYRRDEIIARLSHLKLDDFRRSYHYANFGTTIAAEAVAAAANMKWEDLTEQALFKPLGMVLSSSRHVDYIARENRAVLHAFENGKFQPLFDRNPDEQSPAGGVSSTVEDLAEWLKFILANGRHNGQELASPASLLDALSPHSFSAQPHIVTARPGFYGYGFNTGVHANGRTNFSHSGAFLLGAATAYQIIPSAGIGIVVLTNGSPVGAPESIGMAFMDIVQYGRPLRDWYAAYNSLMKGFYDPEGDLVGKALPTRPRPPLALTSYEGRYENKYFGTADVTIEGEQLVLTMGPKQERLIMDHWDGDAFAIAPRSENAPAGSRSSVIFSMKNERAGGFVVNYLNKNGMAAWKRSAN